MNAIFKALSDPTRRQILEMLKKKEMSAGEIFDQFDITKPAISQHLKVLKEAGLVNTFKHKQFVYYTLNTTMMQDMMTWVLTIGKTKEDK